MTRILLLENQALPMHRLRIESRRSAVAVLYESAAGRAEFERLMARRPDVLVSTLEGIAEMPLPEVIERAAQSRTPLFLVGGDTEEERETLKGWTGRFVASCRRARLAWLPMMIERVLQGEREQEEVRATAQLQQAAKQMREVQKLAIVGRLTGSIVHEINNPLESITNLIYLLSVDQALPAHLRPYVELAEQELQRVTKIAKQTLGFYRETETPVRVELSSLLDEAVVLYARQLEEKRIRVERQYSWAEPVLLFPGEIRQVYANLLANAIEATEPDGCIVLRVHRARRWAPAGPVNGVRVMIADSGSGMPEQVRRRLGQPFFTTKGQRGTGLGLWVSQSIIRRYEGTMQIRSCTEPQRHGTTFSIFLPLNSQALGPKALGPEAVPAGGVGLKVQQVDHAPAELEDLRLRANGR